MDINFVLGIIEAIGIIVIALLVYLIICMALSDDDLGIW